MTPTPDALTELADRCEKAVGEDRELDAEIWMTLHPDWRDYPRNPQGGWDCPTGRTRAAEPFTASIDAAMTLVPPLDDKLRPLTILMGVSENGLRFQTVFKNWQWGAIKSSDRCASYALALCAASLRARAALQPSGDVK